MDSNYQNSNYQKNYNNNQNKRQYYPHPNQFHYQNANNNQNFYNNQNTSTNFYPNNNIINNNNAYSNNAYSDQHRTNTMENKLKNICLNNNAKDFVPKAIPKQEGNEELTQSNKSKTANLNLPARVFIPKNLNENFENKNFIYNQNSEINNQVDYDYYAYESSDNQINENEPVEFLIEGDESDKEIWIPKYQDCECCQGFVYKCKGPACLNMEVCYCKATAEYNFNS